MHHIVEFLVDGKHKAREKEKKQNQMDPKQMRRKPKLERRNALKNVDYDASSSPSCSSLEYASSLVTRSLDFYDSNKTSFRIEGIDGEFDRICRSLGLSGPEDFAIPAAAWEARKQRSCSDLLPRSRLNMNQGEGDDGAVELLEKEEELAELVIDLANKFVGSVSYSDQIDQIESTGASNGAVSPGGDSSFNGGGISGIKGVRPPAVLAPPPSMVRPVVDNGSSTWDLFRAFGPKDDGGSASTANEGYISSEDEDEEFGGTIVEIGQERVYEEKPEETVVRSESGSFTTSNDDDSSSTTIERTSSISPDGRFKHIMSYWEKGELLGRGSFGSVYEGIAGNGFFFAIKEVSLIEQGSQAQQSVFQLEQEIAFLSQFKHENIVQYYGMHKDVSSLYIFLELVTKGSLLSLYQKYHLRDSQVSAYTRQILLGLKYLHDRGVVHRDIKCANILVDVSGSVKLADFGLAKVTKLNDVKSCKGTAFWMAPEVVNRKNQGYGLPADIWSLGCTVLEMLTSSVPYSYLEPMQALFRIGRGVPPEIPSSLSEDARDFITQCLKVNPNARPEASQLLEHPFLKQPLLTPSGSGSPYHFGRGV